MNKTRVALVVGAGYSGGDAKADKSITKEETDDSHLLTFTLQKMICY